MRLMLFATSALLIGTLAQCPADDDDTPTPTPCGDSAVMARYDDCIAADTQRTCEAAGGTWTYVGLAPVKQCQCPTGQENCPCTGTDDCLSSCVAPLDDNYCQGVTSGYCSAVSITVGCYCWFMEEGHAEAICAD